MGKNKSSHRREVTAKPAPLTLPSSASSTTVPLQQNSAVKKASFEVGVLEGLEFVTHICMFKRHAGRYTLLTLLERLEHLVVVVGLLQALQHNNNAIARLSNLYMHREMGAALL